jgi:simple sugar transport system permease protein
MNVSEILSSLMLSYVAIQLLYWLMNGPWKDPEGYNFPQSRLFQDFQTLPYISGIGFLNVPLALLFALMVWFVMAKTTFGFQIRTGGAAPQAARYAGFSSRKTLWTALLLSGGMAGLAGALEVAGPLGQLTPYVPAGYGFAAIIVAFVGRLHPVGIVFSGVLMSMFYIGGELAQSRLGLPKSLTGVFQGLLLFTLLACDTLIYYRVRRRAVASHPAAAAVRVAQSTGKGA